MTATRLSGVGLSLREALPAADLRSIARTLDASEGTTLWCPEFAIRDAVAQLAFVAAHTERLGLATGIAPMAARTPAAAALAAATVDELSGGRMVLGLGVGHESMTLGWHGQRHSSQLTWAEDYLRIVGQALRGEPTDWAGAEAASSGFQLLTGGRPQLPVVLAALGPQMLGLGARCADGVLLNWTTPDSARTSIETVREAAARAGRPAVPVGAYVRVAAGPDAAAQAQAHTAFYAGLPAYRRALLRMGLPEDDLAAAAARELVLQGSADGIVDRARAWREAGVDQLVIYPVGDDESIRSAIDLAVDVVGALASPAGSAPSTSAPAGEARRDP